MGPAGKDGTSGSGSGTVTSVATGAGLTGGPITVAGTLVADWHAGVVAALGSNLTLTGGTLDATGGGSGTAGVTTWNTRDGDVVLLSADVTGALGYTPYSNANPAGYQTAANVTASLAPYALIASSVASFNTRTGPVTLTSLDVTTALTFTPYNATNPSGYQTAANVTASLAPYALSSSVPAARNAARMQAAWDGAAIVENDTYYLCFDAPYAGTINTLKYFTGAGSFSVAIQIGGVSVTGLSAVSVSSATPATATATAANTFSAGAQITAVVTGATGDPVNALLSLAVTWS
jgi:hypothetical protein